MTSSRENIAADKINAEQSQEFLLRSSNENIKKNKEEVFFSDEKRSKRSKIYQIKGTHDKSYLDLSHMMFSSSPVSSESFNSSSERKTVTESTSQLDHLNFLSQESPNLSETYFESNTDIQKAANTRQFARHYSTPLFFQGKYKMVSVSEIEMQKEKPTGFSKISIVSSKQVTHSSENAQPKWKYVLASNSVMSHMKQRGFYSETVSPLLRPERIHAARLKEMEERRRRYAVEIEGEREGENDIYTEDASEEPKEVTDHSMDKDFLKNWPPIYKVLNPEVALAEFGLPVVYKEPSLISKGRMPKYAPHLENVPTPIVTRNFLQPEENWVVYESEPNVVNILFTKQKRDKGLN